MGLIGAQRDKLKVHTQSNPSRWFGSLRRSTLARAIQGSNSIEGIHASIENVLAAVENEEEPGNMEREIWLAIRGYRDAMTYIIQAAQDPHFEFSKQFMKSLQFMMVGYDMTKNPGQWRPGGIFVVNQATGQTVYEGPDSELVNSLVEELASYLKSPLTEPAIVRGAMAHLNLTMIHPFKDGNGRVSRALQTLVLAREGILSPVFCSIEEWLGRVTPEYYSVLAEVGQGKWQPQRDALPWVRFCLKAHYHQAATLIRRNSEYETVFDGIDAIVKRERLDPRVSLPLFDAALGTPITNSWYRRDAEVSELVASRDLRKLSELGLLIPIGERRGRKYEAGPELKKLREGSRLDRPNRDPYELVQDQEVKKRYLAPVEPRLPGV